jgi:hypothetical protein
MFDKGMVHSIIITVKIKRTIRNRCFSLIDRQTRLQEEAEEAEEEEEEE